MESKLFLLIILSFILMTLPFNAQKNQNQILNNLIDSVESNIHSKKVYYNIDYLQLNDTIKNKFIGYIPFDSKIGIGILRFFDNNPFIIVDISKFRSKYSSNFLKFNAKMSFFDFINLNGKPLKIEINFKSRIHRQFYNSVILTYKDYEIKSLPIKSTMALKFMKKQITDISILKKNNKFFKIIKGDFIFISFSSKRGIPKIHEIQKVINPDN